MSRNSSSWASTPRQMTLPRLVWLGASGLISRSMRSRIRVQGFNCSPRLCNTSHAACWQYCLMGSMACRALLSCTSSRGVMRPTAALDVRRSRSPISSRRSLISSRPSGSRMKCSTTSRRRLMALTSCSGKSTQRRIMRPPIGEMVRSMTSSSDLPSSLMGATSSRLRMVNLSRRT